MTRIKIFKKVIHRLLKTTCAIDSTGLASKYLENWFLGGSTLVAIGKLESMPTHDEESGKEKKPKNRNVKNIKQSEDYFGPQYNKTSELPNPDASLRALATGVVEVIGGARQIGQLSRYLTDDVYQRLARRAILAREQREELGQKAHFQNFSVQNMITSSPRDGVIESVVLLKSPRRVRAVTIRLEGINSRWRATSVTVL